jgi:hypothetical protein
MTFALCESADAKDSVHPTPVITAVRFEYGMQTHAKCNFPAPAFPVDMVDQPAGVTAVVDHMRADRSESFPIWTHEGFGTQTRLFVCMGGSRTHEQSKSCKNDEDPPKIHCFTLLP